MGHDSAFREHLLEGLRPENAVPVDHVVFQRIADGVDPLAVALQPGPTRLGVRSVVVEVKGVDTPCSLEVGGLIGRWCFLANWFGYTGLFPVERNGEGLSSRLDRSTSTAIRNAYKEMCRLFNKLLRAHFRQ